MNKAPAEMKEFMTQFAPIAQPGTYRPTVQDQALAYISLYMPNTLNTQIQSNYDSVSATQAFGIGGYLGNMIGDALKSKSPMASNPVNILGDDYARHLAAKGIGAAADLLGGNAGDVAGIVGQALKQIGRAHV